MGRDKPKKFSKMGYFDKIRFYEEQGDKYNVNREQFENSQGGGGGRYEDFDDDGYRKAVNQAMSNDYDTRRSIELAQESGNKKAQKLGSGISNSAEAVNAQRFMAKTHSNRMGNTGKYDGANDEGNVLNYWKDKVMGKREAQFDKMTNDINGMRNEIEAKDGVQEQATVNPQSFEHSDAVSKAQDNLDKYKLSLGASDGLFAKSNEPAPRADDQNDATAAFADQYKMDVSKATDLGEVKARNLNNAASVVASYRQ